MRRSVMALSLCLSTLVLVAGKCDGDDVVTTSKDAPAAAAPDSVSEDAAAALGEPPAPDDATLGGAGGDVGDSAALGEPAPDSVGEAAATDASGADKSAGAGGDGDIFTDPLGGENPSAGSPIDDLGDAPIEDSFLDDPSFEPEPPPVDEP